MPTFILIHLTVWPQYTNVTERQTDKGPIAQGEPFYKRSPKNAGIFDVVPHKMYSYNKAIVDVTLRPAGAASW